ncbi:glycosyltransferase [Planktomarina temperata]|nr:glycosyltransferase [Planktomarina temperata]
MPDHPLISICIITYNHESYIADCLDSILQQQTSFDFEIIIGDDFSTDRTREIITKYYNEHPDKIKLLFQSTNSGGQKNYIDTHNAATGTYVCHCDGDDLFLPEKLQQQADFLSENAEYSVVWTKANIFSDHGSRFEGNNSTYAMLENGEIDFETSLMYGSLGIHSSIMYRRSARISTNPKFQTLDLFYTWEFLSSGKGKILDAVLTEYRVNSSSTLSSNSGSAIRSLNAHHALYYFQKYPTYRRAIFIFSLFNFLIDLKNLRGSFICFVPNLIKTASLITPTFFIQYVRLAKSMRMPDNFR